MGFFFANHLRGSGTTTSLCMIREVTIPCTTPSPYAAAVNAAADCGHVRVPQLCVAHGAPVSVRCHVCVQLQHPNRSPRGALSLSLTLLSNALNPPATLPTSRPPHMRVDVCFVIVSPATYLLLIPFHRCFLSCCLCTPCPCPFPWLSVHAQLDVCQQVGHHRVHAHPGCGLHPAGCHHCQAQELPP